MDNHRIILDRDHFELTIERLCHQLIEEYDLFKDTCIVGLQPRGIHFANRIYQRLCELLGHNDLQYGKLDITFYRDDFRTRQKPLKASVTEIDFLVENKKVILIDDVLYSGRTVQAALTALNHYGRPKSVELIVLVDRRFNRHLPVEADFVGITVDALDKAYVKVEWKEFHKEDRVLIFADKHDAE
ncbi:MAG: bifunctional pyr operon transcriptional regulator/uracil phosphoribosyltransferase PyrR [Bacteroidetes bacterium]|nr:bifunctional pyr operon transcriptional regulator/uracil phosphoribosyltransferase PyrR [Bacteroidota bacterium]